MARVVSEPRLRARLASIARRALREACGGCRECYMQAVAGELRPETAEEAVDRAVLSAMSSAYWAVVGVELSDANKPKHVREALRDMYYAVRRAGATENMSVVREAFLNNISDIARGKRKTLRKAFDQAGLSRENPALVKTIVDTQVAMAAAAADWLASAEDDEVWGYEYVTAADERVRITHVPLHGVRYPKNHQFWDKYAPPNGWNCRCKLRRIMRGAPNAKIKAFRGTPRIERAFLFNPGKLL